MLSSLRDCAASRYERQAADAAPACSRGRQPTVSGVKKLIKPRRGDRANVIGFCRPSGALTFNPTQIRWLAPPATCFRPYGTLAPPATCSRPYGTLAPPVTCSRLYKTLAPPATCFRPYGTESAIAMVGEIWPAPYLHVLLLKQERTNCTDQTRISWITRPWTSVRRRKMPLW